MTVQLCGAKKKQGPGTCTQAAGWGTDHPGSGHCKLHGGSTAGGKKKAQKEEAVKAVAIYGLAREIDPHTALLEELHRTAGHVAWLAQIIRAGEIAKAESPTGRSRVVKMDQAVFGGGEQPSVWMALYHEERKHLAAVAKTCIAVGIEERKVKIAEQQGQVLADVIRGILTELDVIDRPEVPGVVRRHLTLVTQAG